MIIKINKQKLDGSESYDFKIMPERPKEDIRDFHMFCLSIVMDLLKHKFNLNEIGEFSYDLSYISEMDITDTYELLHLLYNKIYIEKNDLDSQLDDLLK